MIDRAELRERVAKAIWLARPDCKGKPWPRETPKQRKNYGHDPIAACDLCLLYADAALGVFDEYEDGSDWAKRDNTPDV